MLLAPVTVNHLGEIRNLYAPLEKEISGNGDYCNMAQNFGCIQCCVHVSLPFLI